MSGRVAIIIRCINQIGNQFEVRVKVDRHDGATEFATNTLDSFYVSKGIQQQFTGRYAHSANGTAERAVRTIVTIGRTLLLYASLDTSFWGEAVQTAVYIKNRLPSPKSGSKTPFTLIDGKPPSVTHMRILGVWRMR
jgi:hypothetical protein